MDYLVFPARVSPAIHQQERIWRFYRFPVQVVTMGGQPLTSIPTSKHTSKHKTQQSLILDRLSIYELTQTRHIPMVLGIPSIPL